MLSPSTTEAVTTFFALLALLAAAIAVAIVVSALTGDRLGVIAALRPIAVEVAAAVATTAMVGSLILSEVIGYEPCLNCWIQRGFMYPASLLLLAALFTRKAALVAAAGVLATLGLPVAVFHRIEQAIGTEIGGVCDAATPCSAKWVEHFGFMTIPTMAGCGFAAVIALVAIHFFPRNPSPARTDADTDTLGEENEELEPLTS
jgi:disulfide bond formation protein DsbB